MKHIFIFFLLLLTTNMVAQNKLLVNSKKMKSAKDICKGCVLHTGNVSFKSKGSVIKCDRALQNNNTNTVDCTGNIRIYRSGNKHPLRGDKLIFDGNTNIAHLRDNIIYQDEKVSFTTDKFDYNTKTDEGHYFDGGIIKDSLNTLESKRGYVFKNDDIIVKDSVVITTPDYLVLADSLKYNSTQKKVYIIGPTTLYSDSSTLYAEGGYYLTDVSYAFLTDNAHMEQANYTLDGDTVAYNKTTKIGEGWGNIEMNDTIQMLLLRGNYVYHDGNTEYSYMTDSAQALLYSGFDTLFAHADTFTNFIDTAGVKYFTGSPNVRFFRLDIQGKCDSMVYNMEEEIATMYDAPMMWSLYNQMSGDIINIYNRNNRVSHIELVDDAFIVSREDSIRFNQVRGKTITGYISNNDLRKIEVDGSAESIYYSREGLTLVGYNQTQSSYLTIHLKNGAITKLALTPTSSGNFYPIESKPYEEQFLHGFQWRSDLRPISPRDIFRVTPREKTKKRKRKRPKR